MSFFDDQIKVIHIDDENSVTIRCLRRSDMDDIQALATKRNSRGVANFDSAKATYLVMERGIVSWSGPGFDGREPTIETFKLLPSYVATPIFDAINEFGELPEDEKKL